MKNFKNEFNFSLTTYSDVIAISFNNLKYLKLLPYDIELIDGSRPIKQTKKNLWNFPGTTIQYF